MRLGCAALAMKRTARGAIRGGVAGKHWTRLRSPSGEEVDLAVGASDGGLTFVYFFKSGQVPSECTGLDEVAPERLPEVLPPPPSVLFVVIFWAKLTSDVW